LRLSISAAAAAALIFAAPASAAVPHTVGPAETLWSIAAASNLTTRSLAAANGLSPEAQVILGQTIQIPSEAEAAAALGGTGGVAGSAPAQPAAGTAAPPPAGAYEVRAGDTLTAIARRAGVTPRQIAAMNGLDPAGPLLSGTVLKLPAATAPAVNAQAQAPPPAKTRVPDAPPYATPGRTNAAEIGQIASAHGVSPSLAAAIAWQESGFNNGLVSSANARGVMQILPGTWWWIQDQLGSQPLDPASPRENVHAGVMYLGQLLRDTGGDERTAVASYYQGLVSVRSRGLFEDTKQYVDAVMAHRGRFGGP
jgi:N-acetylmuramoyl-L-alanine amidase